MIVFKILTTVFIGIMMLMFLAIWISTAEEKEYTWVWVLLEIVYVCSLVSIWG